MYILLTKKFSDFRSVNHTVNLSTSSRSCSSCLQQFTTYDCVPYQPLKCLPPYYEFANGSCLTTCPTPLVINYNGDSQSCTYPCRAGQFLYWNRACRSYCNFPLVSYMVGQDSYCLNPCPYNILYWNGSCLGSCLYPLMRRYDASSIFCDFPCSSAGQYLYWNQSCSTSCRIPLAARSIAGNLYCIYPCNSKFNEYLKWNGECIRSCPSNLVPYKFQGLLYCNLPTPAFSFSQSDAESNIFYLKFNQVMNGSELELNSSFIFTFAFTSSSDFNYQVLKLANDFFQVNLVPRISISKQRLTIIFTNFIYNYFGVGLIKRNSSIEIRPIYSQQAIQTIKAVKSTSESAMQSIGAGSLPLTILGSNPVFLWIMLNLIQTYYYLMFINVEYPLNLNSLLELFKIGTIDFLPIKFFYFDLKKYSLGSPQKFANQNMDSFFLASGGSNLSIIFVFFFGSLLCYIIDKFMRNLPFRLPLIARYSSSHFFPNLMRLWDALYLNLCIAAYLQLTNLNSNDSIHRFSSILSYLVIVMSFYLLVHKFKQSKLDVKKAKSLLAMIKPSKFRSGSKLCLMQPFFDSLSKMMFAIILVFLYQYQKTQMAAMIMLKLAYALYLITCRPFSNIISNASVIASEIFYTMSLIMVALLNNLNMDPTTREDTKLTVGYMVIGFCMTSILFTVTLMCGSAAIGAREIWTKIRNSKLLKKKSKLTKRRIKRIKQKTTRKIYFQNEIE